jgi:hypothetical protein
VTIIICTYALFSFRNSFQITVNIEICRNLIEALGAHVCVCVNAREKARVIKLNIHPPHTHTHTFVEKMYSEKVIMGFESETIGKRMVWNLELSA